MKLVYVTLTGADNSVSPNQLVEISQKYRFVEWAILFSQKKSGTARYPTLDWIDDLCEVARNSAINLSAHLCGKWVDDVMAGNFTFLKNKNWANTFDRIQLNMGKERLQQAVGSDRFLRTVGEAVNNNYQVIIGGNYTQVTVDNNYFWNNYLFPLFDASGGRGIGSKYWPEPFVGSSGVAIMHGYAGGLGPDNVCNELKNIEKVAKDTVIWIDMETSLREKSASNDVFSLVKCNKVLESVKSWIQQ